MTRSPRRRDVLRGIGAATVTSLAGCTGSVGGGGGRTIKLGMLMGVTGELKELGPPIRNSSALVSQQVNDADTSFSVDTQFEDTATSTSQGVSGGEALVNAGYPMICGALSSEVTLQVAQSVSVPNEVVQCSPASTSPRITDLSDNDYLFRTAATDALQGRVLAQIARNRIDAQSASTLTLNNAYGNGLAQGFATAFKEQGDTITAQVSFAKGKQSYTSQLQKALNGDPDTMLIVGYPESGVRIFRDFYSNFDRPDMPILVADGLKAESLQDDVGRDLTNVSGTAPVGEGPGLEFFNSQVEENFDFSTSQPFIRQAYDAAAALVLANAAAGENSGPAIRDQMRSVTGEGGTKITPGDLVDGIERAADGEDIKYQGVAGPVEFNENGDLATATYEYYKFTSSGIKTVTTIQP